MVTVLKGRLAVVLLAAAVLAGQIFAAQHIHADDDPIACVICVHAETTPTVESRHSDFARTSVSQFFAAWLPAPVQQSLRLAPPARASPNL